MSGQHLPITPSILYFGTPVVLVVTSNQDGSANITPISSAWALGQRVVLGFGIAGQGIGNLLRSGECTLNFPSAELWANVESIARTTGLSPVPADKAEMGYVHAKDKFVLGGFTPDLSMLVRTPRIRECPLQMEAKLVACHRSAAEGTLAPPPHVMVELSILQTHAVREIVVPDTSRIDTSRYNPLFYVFRHYFGHARDVGQNFRAEGGAQCAMTSAAQPRAAIGA